MENRMEFIRAQQIERRMSVRVPVRLPVIVNSLLGSRKSFAGRDVQHKL